MRKLLLTLLLTFSLVLMGCGGSEPQKELIETQEMEPTKEPMMDADVSTESEETVIEDAVVEETMQDDATEETSMVAEELTPRDEALAEEEAVETEEELDEVVADAQEADSLDSELDALFE